MHAAHEDYSQCMQERQQEMIKCVLPVPTCLVLLGVSVELEQSIRDGGKGAPQTTHRTLVNGDWRGRVGEGEDQTTGTTQSITFARGEQ